MAATAIGPRASSGGDSSLGGEQIEGRNAVRELLSVERRRTYELWLQEGLAPAIVLDEIVELAKDARVPVRTVGAYELDDLAEKRGSPGCHRPRRAARVG